jgi:D-tyrosyl-tRNA(Tyr) deacylase
MSYGITPAGARRAVRRRACRRFHPIRTENVRLVLQRVLSASVEVAEETVGAIGRGLLVLVGVERGDGPAQVAAAAEKLAGLRIFEDGEGKMNLDAQAAGGAFLVVSQFTLAGSLARGRRPSFDKAAPPEEARPLVDALVENLRGRGYTVETGRFQAHMAVALVNDGPVTFVLEV